MKPQNPSDDDFMDQLVLGDLAGGGRPDPAPAESIATAPAAPAVHAVQAPERAPAPATVAETAAPIETLPASVDVPVVEEVVEAFTGASPAGVLPSVKDRVKRFLTSRRPAGHSVTDVEDARMLDAAAKVTPAAAAPAAAPEVEPIPAPALVVSPKKNTSEPRIPAQVQAHAETAPAAKAPTKSPKASATKSLSPKVLKPAAVAAGVLALIGMAYFAGQRSPIAQNNPAIQDHAAASATGLASDFGAPVPVAASGASAPNMNVNGEPVPDSVIAAASANLPPVASLPPAVDERKLDQKQPPAASGKGAPAQVAATAPTTAAQTQQQQQAKDQLIALGEEVQDRAAAPQGDPSKHTTPLRPAAGAAPASSAKAEPVKAAAEAPTAQQARKMKYGSMGITALTAQSVVVVINKSQTAVKVGQALQDGSVVQAIDPKNHRINTNRGVIQLD